MRRSIVPALAFVLPVLLPCLEISPALAQARDIAGARDYPGIGRFAGSVITGYQVKDFDATRLQAAAFRDGKATDERRPEGRITRIAYPATRGPRSSRSRATSRPSSPRPASRPCSPATP